MIALLVVPVLLLGFAAVLIFGPGSKNTAELVALGKSLAECNPMGMAAAPVLDTSAFATCP